ncbi:MAG: right-handed parallel beta-helix repeat-containing protein [Planctomycetes bacterium]|nr:right-handed parallel beta-helix repeat-containing protein [Planctomycetota bacterium]
MQRIAMACVLLMLSDAGASEAAPGKKLPLGMFFVAPDGNDAHPGTRERPFATISRARDAVRERIASGPLTSDIQVIIRAGTYRLEEPLVFGPQDSGTERFAIRYVAQGDVVVTGGRRITGWKQSEHNRWTVTLPEVKQGKWHFRQLWSDGRRLPRGRFPDQDMLTIKTVSKDARTLAFKEPLPSGNLGGKDCELVVIQNWSIARGIIESSTGNSVTTATPMGYVGHRWTTASPGKHAYLEHAPEFVNDAGEWYLDRKTGVLTYQAANGENPNEHEFIAPVLEELLVIEGTAEKPVKNLHFVGVRFLHTAWPIPEIGYAGIQAAHYGDREIEKPTFAVPLAIRLVYTEDCGFEGCVIGHTGASGLGLGAGCRNNRIVGCEIADVGGNGLMVGWRPKADKPPRQWFEHNWDRTRDVPVSNEISNCYVHRCGQQMFGAVGIYDAFARGTRIVHNLVTDLPYTGISIGFRWDTKPTDQRECLVAFNHIHDVMKVLADGGGIYTLGFQPGTVLRGNVIHDVHRSPYTHGGAPNNGIFFDQGSKGYLIEDNVIYNTSGGAIRFNQNKKSWHTWRNNSFGVKPGDPGFPSEAVQKAGLEPPWKQKLLGR